MYELAFADAGGQDALDAVEGIAKQLATEIPDGRAKDSCGWDRSYRPYQMGAYESYDIDFMTETLGAAEDTGAKSKVRERGEWLMKQLGTDIQQRISRDIHLQIAEVKKMERARVKVAIKYGYDCSQLCDLNRVTLVCPDIRSMYAVAQHLFKRFGPKVCLQGARLLEWEDRYQSPMNGGYRHLQAIMCIGASLWEIQINTAPMNWAKHAAGHKLYKTTRFVREMVLFAAMEGDCRALEEMLARPGVQGVANPDAVRDKNGLSALHHAAFRGDAEIVTLLLSGKCMARPASAWVLDDAAHGGLALNYALTLCHYEVAQTLVDAMADQMGLATIERKTKQRLAEAVAAMVDRFEYVKDSDNQAPGAEEAERLLRSLASLWYHAQAASADDWDGMDPLKYAFARGQDVEEQGHAAGRHGPVGAVSSIPILLEFVDLWSVDKGNKLPLERATAMGLRATTELLARKMMSSRPPVDELPGAVIWSLARCRNKATFPEELQREVMVRETMLRQGLVGRQLGRGPRTAAPGPWGPASLGMVEQAWSPGGARAGLALTAELPRMGGPPNKKDEAQKTATVPGKFFSGQRPAAAAAAAHGQPTRHLRQQQQPEEEPQPQPRLTPRAVTAIGTERSRAPPRSLAHGPRSPARPQRGGPRASGGWPGGALPAGGGARPETRAPAGLGLPAGPLTARF